MAPSSLSWSLVVALSAFKTAVTTFPFGRAMVAPLGDERDRDQLCRLS